MFFLNSRGRNCSIFPTKNLPLGSEFLKSMVQTEVSFVLPKVNLDFFRKAYNVV